MLVLAITFLSAISLLMLNTMRAEQSFTLNKLRGDVSTLQDREQALKSDLSAVSAPENLALKADEIGMVPAPKIVYKSQRTGKTIGVAGSAVGNNPASVNTLPDTPASQAADDVMSGGKVGNHITDPAKRVAEEAKRKADEAAKQKKAAGAQKSLQPAAGTPGGEKRTTKN